MQVTFGSQTIKVTVSSAAIALSEAQRAQESAAFAEAFSGPVYADQSAGEAATTEGHIFRVGNGDGPPETTTAYRRTASGSVELAPLATTADLADPTKGAVLVGFKQPGLDAAPRTQFDINTEVVSIRDGGAAGDGATDDQAAVKKVLDEVSGRIRIPRGVYRIGAGDSGSGVRIRHSNTHLYFDKGASFLPLNDASPTTMILAQGSEPSAWVVLSADAAEGSATFTLASDPGWQAGDWVELRSDGALPGVPNSKGTKRSQLAKIVSVFGTGPYTFLIDRALHYAFGVADNAVAGKPTVLEDIVIENATLNKIAADQNMKFGIYLKYVAGFRLINPAGYRSKDPYGPDGSSHDFIKMINCVDGDISDPRMVHGAYYGISVAGACENIDVWGGVFEDMRHATSIVWQDGGDTYGMPIGIRYHSVTAINTTKSAFDEHDVGRDVAYDHCAAFGAGERGFQLRSSGSVLTACIARYNALDGFAQDSAAAGASGHILRDCIAEHNGRYGAFMPSGSAQILGGRYAHNGSASNPTGATATGAGPQIGILTGRVENVVLDNAEPLATTGAAIKVTNPLGRAIDERLIISGVRAAKTAGMLYFIHYSTSDNVPSLKHVELCNQNQIIGFGSDLFRIGGGAGPNGGPVSDGSNIISDVSATDINIATLTAGTVTVTSSQIRNLAGSTIREAIQSRIHLDRVSAGGTIGALFAERGADLANFTINSSNPADTSTVAWRLRL